MSVTTKLNSNYCSTGRQGRASYRALAEEEIRKSKGEADRERKREWKIQKEKQTQLTEETADGFSPRSCKV